jgi:hypothetical protein
VAAFRQAPQSFRRWISSAVQQAAADSLRQGREPARCLEGIWLFGLIVSNMASLNKESPAMVGNLSPGFPLNGERWRERHAWTTAPPKKCK